MTHETKTPEREHIDPIWVSADLKIWRPLYPTFIARDCGVDDRYYRRLDPAYFAWLKLRMDGIRAEAHAGHLPVPVFDEAQQRFDAVQCAAEAMFGEAALTEARRTFDLDAYRPPPLPGKHKPSKAAVSAVPGPTPEAARLERARELVDAIRDQALTLGRSADSLYCTDGYEPRSFAANRGLVCYIHSQDRIEEEVTRESIQIVRPPLETTLRFYNPDLEQPWRQTTKRM
jgi:hypothetical protein